VWYLKITAFLIFTAYALFLLRHVISQIYKQFIAYFSLSKKKSIRTNQKINVNRQQPSVKINPKDKQYYWDDVDKYI
jgi:hypothetical protein